MMFVHYLYKYISKYISLASIYTSSSIYDVMLSTSIGYRGVYKLYLHRYNVNLFRALAYSQHVLSSPFWLTF